MKWKVVQYEEEGEEFVTCKCGDYRPATEACNCKEFGYHIFDAHEDGCWYSTWAVSAESAARKVAESDYFEGDRYDPKDIEYTIYIRERDSKKERLFKVTADVQIEFIAEEK